MAGKGMGCASRGGGAVESGAKNRVISETSKTTGPIMMSKGGAANKGKKAMDKPVGKMGGGMMAKGYKKGGAC